MEIDSKSIIGSWGETHIMIKIVAVLYAIFLGRATISLSSNKNIMQCGTHN